MMTRFDRRSFLSHSCIGLAAGGGLLTLHCDAHPTPSSGELGEFEDVVRVSSGQVAIEVPPVEAKVEWPATEDNILGPYFRDKAPFRAKVTPPLEPGESLVVRGRVWGFDTKRPLTNAVLHVWQANAAGRYDNDDPRNPPKKGVFYNRARLVVDETGYYEYETIKPGRYKIGPRRWRPAHIHYLVHAPGYRQLVTQLYFKGDPENRRDDFIKPSLIIDPQVVATRQGNVMVGTFDIVLQRA